jgi:hypothetical protein
LKTQWRKIAIAGLIGGVIGIVYAEKQPITYTAKMTFIVEGGKSGSNVAGLGGIAGQFGLDLTGSVGGGLFSGDNINVYFKSDNLARFVLLSKYDSTSSTTLADKYAEVYKLKQGWAQNKKIGRINFSQMNPNSASSRLNDSLLQSLIFRIRGHLNMDRPEKKTGFIEIKITMINEALAKKFCERFVEKAVDQYISQNTQKQTAIIEKLQARADSLSFLLKSTTVSSARLQNSSVTMDINPLYRVGSAVASEITIREKTMLATMFSSVVQNLELAKFNLSQETPVIQVLDKPYLPLILNKMSKAKYAIFFSFISVLIISIFFTIKSFFL